IRISDIKVQRMHPRPKGKRRRLFKMGEQKRNSRLLVKPYKETRRILFGNKQRNDRSGMEKRKDRIRRKREKIRGITVPRHRSRNHTKASIKSVNEGGTYSKEREESTKIRKYTDLFHRWIFKES